MTDDPAHTANNTPSPTGKARATKPAPAATAAAPKEKPRGMSYGGVSAAQHALDRLERATGQSKHGRRP
jgi:hypothetical protein